MPDSSLAWREDQDAIYAWLRSKAPGLAEAYEAAFWVLKERTPGAVRFAPQACRDLMNRLADVDPANNLPGRLDYRLLVEELKGVWSEQWGEVSVGEAPSSTGGSDLTVEIRRDAARQVTKIVTRHKNASTVARQRDLAVARLVSVKEKVDPGDRLVDEVHAISEGFRNTHFGPKLMTTELETVITNFRRMEALFLSKIKPVESPVDSLRRLKALIDDANQSST